MDKQLHTKAMAWTAKEEIKLLRLYESGMDKKDIAKEMSRTYNSCSAKYYKLKYGEPKDKIIRTKKRVYKMDLSTKTGIKFESAKPNQCQYMKDDTRFICGKEVYKNAYCEDCYNICYIKKAEK